jgi:protocatechuate 3,4-dioxygenase beta subunit
MRFKFLSVLILFAVFAISNSVSAGQVRGKTVNPENKAPVKGIFAIAKNQGGFDTASSPDRFIKISVTGDDGVFLLDIPEDGKGYEVIISDKEYDGFIYEGFSHLSKSEDLGVIELKRKCSLTGKVTDEKNNPITGADVKAEIRLKKYTCSHHVKAAAAKTSSDGSFEFKDLAPREYKISVDSENLFSDPATVSVSEDFNYVAFKMKPACSIKGKVETADGKPVSGINLMSGSKTSVSGVDGSFKLSGLGTGEQRIFLSGENYVIASKDGVKVTCSTEKAAECKVIVVSAGKLTVMLSQKEGISPPGNITIALIPEGDKSYSSSSYTSAVKDGKALFKALKPAKYKIEIKGDRNLPKIKSAVTIESGNTAEIKAEPVETFGVRGKLTDDNSNPVKQIGLRISPAEKKKDSTDNHMSSEYKNSGNDGTFVFENLIPGKYEITVEHDGWMKTKVQAEAGPQMKTEITIKLEKGLSISGQVFEADATHVPNLSVSISGKNGLNPNDYVYKHGKADKDGRFSISGFPEGKFDLRINDESSINTISTLSGVMAGSEGIIITLAPNHKIEFIAVDEDGKPVADAEIKSERAEYASLNYNVSRPAKDSVKSGSDGKLTAMLRQGNKYVVSAIKAPMLPGKATIDLTLLNPAPASPVTLTLIKGVSVSGKAVDPSGKPLKGLLITDKKPVNTLFDFNIDTESGKGDTVKQPLTDESGNFRIDSLAPGAITLYAVTAGKPGILLSEKKIDINKGSPTEINFAIPETVNLKGVVIDANGNPASEGFLNIFNVDNPTVTVKTKTGEQGKFEIPMIPSGKYSIAWHVKTDGILSSGVIVVLINSSTGDLILGGKTSEKKSLSTKGTVTRNGKPLQAELAFMPVPPDGRVPELKDISAFSATAKQADSNENGKFEVEGIGAGKFIYTATSKDGICSGRIEIKDPAQDLNLNLVTGSIKGKITDPDGAAAADASLEFIPSICNFDTFLLTASGETKNDGSYSVQEIPAGKFHIVVWHSKGMACLNGIEFDAKEKVLDIKLEKGFNVSGKILLDSGKPANFAQVIAVNENEMPLATASVNPNTGTYSIGVPLPKGKYRFFAVLKNYSTEAAELDINGDTVFDAVLLQAGSARLKNIASKHIDKDKLEVKTADGKKVLRLGKFSPSYRSLCDIGICLTDSKGETAISGLRPGDYVISCGSGKEMKFTVKSQEETLVENK